MTVVPSFRRDGTVMNLAAPQISDIDFAEMAAGLSKLARFNGRYACASYSVAQHSVFCADALHAETGDAVLAGCGLLHDGHEYLFGDQPTPSSMLISANVANIMRDGGFAPDVVERAARAVGEAIDAAKAAIDSAIFAAAGVGYPHLYPGYVRQVRDIDARMLRAEAIALFGRKAGAHLPAARRPAPKLTAPIEPWGAMKAEMAFIDRLERYLGIIARAS